MGLTFRKSANLTKNTKLNVTSKSVGVSTGVKGARVSFNSRNGITLSLGAGGLRYRKKLDSASGLIMICLYFCLMIAEFFIKLLWLFCKLMFLCVWIPCKYFFVCAWWLIKNIWSIIQTYAPVLFATIKSKIKKEGKND